MDYDELSEIQEEIRLVNAIGDRYKQMYFNYGHPVFKKLSDESYEAKDFLKQVLKKTVEVTL